MMTKAATCNDKQSLFLDDDSNINKQKDGRKNENSELLDNSLFKDEEPIVLYFVHWVKGKGVGRNATKCRLPKT